MNATKKKSGKKHTKTFSLHVQAYGQRWEGVSQATAEDARKFESVVGAKLPSELKDFMCTCGGGSPTKDFYISDESEVLDLGIGYILPLCEVKKLSTAATVVTLYREKQALPRDLVPFAYDTGHANLICLRLKKMDIVYWLHDDHENPIRYVAPSLADFLEGLDECPF